MIWSAALGWFTRQLQPLLIAALVALSAWCFWSEYRLSAEQREHGRTKAAAELREAQWQQRLAAWKDAALQAEQRERAREQHWAAERSRWEADRAEERKRLEGRIALLSAAGDQLRRDLAAAAAECGDQAGQDPAAACRAYAAALGELLARYRAAGLRAGEAAEEHARDVERLLAEWPADRATDPAAN